MTFRYPITIVRRPGTCPFLALTFFGDRKNTARIFYLQKYWRVIVLCAESTGVVHHMDKGKMIVMGAVVFLCPLYDHHLNNEVEVAPAPAAGGSSLFRYDFGKTRSLTPARGASADVVKGHEHEPLHRSESEWQGLEARWTSKTYMKRIDSMIIGQEAGCG